MAEDGHDAALLAALLKIMPEGHRLTRLDAPVDATEPVRRAEHPLIAMCREALEAE